MINLKLLNEALGNVSSDEFAVLYFIANTISLKKEGRTRIYRELIADKLGWLNEARPEYAIKKVTRATNSLVEKGYLIKEEVFISPQKSVTFYALPTQKSDKKLTPSTQKNVPLNNNEKEGKKVNNNEKEIKEEKVEKNVLFETNCGLPMEIVEEYQKIKNAPDEETVSEHKKRIRRINELEHEHPELVYS